MLVECIAIVEMRRLGSKEVRICHGDTVHREESDSKVVINKVTGKKH